MKFLVHQWDTENLRHKRETLIVDTPAQIQDRNQRANCKFKHTLTLNLPTTTIVAQPFNVIKWQLKFNPVA